MMPHPVRVALTAAMAGILLASGVLGETGVSDHEIVIGNCSVQSGQNKSQGVAYLEGARAYFDYVNEEMGGIHGRKIQLTVLDDGYDPDQAIECFNRLLEKEVFAGAFFVGSAQGAKYVLMAQVNKLPILGFTAGADFFYEPFKRYVFAVRASYADETAQDIDHLWNDLGIRKIGIIFQNDAFGASALRGVQLALDKHGAQLVAQASYERNTLNVGEAVRQVKAANPEAVILAALTSPLTEILNESVRSGWKPLFIAVAGRDSLILEQAGRASEGVIMAGVVPPPTETHLPAIALYRRVLRKYLPSAEPGTQSVQSFVDAMILTEGIRRAGKELTRERLVDSLESLHDFNVGLGPNFKIHYRPDSHKAFDAFFFTVIRNGKVEALRDWSSLKSRKSERSRSD